jgi:hypothetical protein
MSSTNDKDAHLAQRAGAAAAGEKNHPLTTTTKGIRQSGRHTEVIRQGNPGRTNQQKGK